MRHLSLAANNIGPDTADILADMIRECWSLESLDLSDNRIGDEGLTKICQALRSNSTLTELNISANVITPKGAWVMRELFHGCKGSVPKGNSTLTAVDLSRNLANFSDIMPYRARPPMMFPDKDESWEEEVYSSRPSAGATGHQQERADKTYCTAGWGRDKMAAGNWRIEHAAQSGAPLEYLLSRSASFHESSGPRADRRPSWLSPSQQQKSAVCQYLRFS